MAILIRSGLAIAALGVLAGAGTAVNSAENDDSEIVSAFAENDHRFEVDHVFFFTERFAPEMTAFELAGFHRWPFTNSHFD